MRRDIQFLRGLSVIAVLIYHAGIGYSANGYLGVDVFFVVSGYLITLNIIRELHRKTFRFSGFYTRRASRLLPALYCTLFFTTLASYLILTDRQWVDYLNQLYGSLSFTSNIVLAQQVGYFADAANTKPLLHIWSLSLEEQYYFLIPMLLFLGSRNTRLILVTFLLLGGVSFLLYLYAYYGPNSSVTYFDVTLREWGFFLLPMRAWELLAGSVVAWIHFSEIKIRIPSILAMIGLAVLAILLIHPEEWTFWLDPRVIAVTITSILIVNTGEWISRVPFSSVIEKIGDWSYSIYLVHWPILSFAFVAYLGSVPKSVTYFLVLLSVLLGAMQYKYVEQRFRMAHQRGVVRPTISVRGLLLSTFAIVALTFPHLISGYSNIPAENLSSSNFRQLNIGLSYRCAQGKEEYWNTECRSSSSPQFAVWGDSYAMHLIPGLLQHPEIVGGLVQLTKSACNPALGLTGIHSGLPAASACIEFNDKVLDFIRKTDSITHVIISSPFGYFYGGSSEFLYQGQKIERDREIAISALTDAIQLLQNEGKIVSIVSPPPSAGFNIGECLEREASGALILGRKNCNIDSAKAFKRRESVTRSLQKVQSLTGVPVVRFEDYICNASECATKIGGVPIYRDQGHLSISGSQKIVPTMSLFGLSSVRGNTPIFD